MPDTDATMRQAAGHRVCDNLNAPGNGLRSFDTGCEKGRQIVADVSCGGVSSRDSRSLRARTVPSYRIAPTNPCKIKPKPMPVLDTSARTVSSSRIRLDIQGCTTPLRGRSRTKASQEPVRSKTPGNTGTSRIKIVIACSSLFLI